MGADPDKAQSDIPASPCLVLDSPIVGMVVTISPNFSLYRMVVLPAASKPTATEKGGQRMETGAREPPRDQGQGEAWPADGDGGGEQERLQVRALLHLPGLEGSLGGKCQLLPLKCPRGERG